MEKAATNNGRYQTNSEAKKQISHDKNTLFDKNEYFIFKRNTPLLAAGSADATFD
jgi:hypothetical protein